MNQGYFLAFQMRFLVTDRFHVDRRSETLVVDGESVPIQNRTYQVMSLLMSRPGELVTKRELFEKIWGTLEVSDAVLTTAIKELRQALGDDARNPWAIATVHARGYRFLLDVHESDTPEVPSQPGTEDEGTRAWPRTGHAALAAGVVAVLLYFLLPNQSLHQEPPATPAEKSIAVLPFDDLSREGDQRWFADGLAEEILNSLAQSEDLLVAARTSSFRYGAGSDDIREIGNALDVSYVMEGSVRRDAGQLRVTAQLIRADDGFHVWSKTYDLPVDSRNALSLQRNIAEDVLVTFEADVAQTVTENPQAEIPLELYERYLRGRQLVMSRREEGVLEGLDELSALVQLAPDFAPGHAWLAYAYLFSTQFSGRPLLESATAAELHVRRAIGLDPDGADALTAAALLELMRRDNQTALDYANRAVASNPNHVPALRRRGVILLNLGKVPEAQRDFMAVMARDPLSPISLGHVADTHWFLDQRTQALDAAQEGVRWNPNDSIANATLGRILADAGEYLAALEFLERSFEINPNPALTTLALSALYWQVGLDDLVDFADLPLVWNGLAARALSDGDFDTALQLAETYAMSSTGSLNGMQLYHWFDDTELAYPQAMRFAAHYHLDGPGLNYGYIRGAIPALLALEANGDPQATLIRERVAALFANKKPGDLAFGAAVYGAASWQMINGNSDEALAWLNDAVNKGFIFRPLHFDPTWDPVRQTAAFQSILRASDEHAEAVRIEYLGSQ